MPPYQANKILFRAHFLDAVVARQLMLVRDREDFVAVDFVVDEGLEQGLDVDALVQQEGEDVEGFPVQALLGVDLEFEVQVLHEVSFILLQLGGIQHCQIHFMDSTLNSTASSRILLLVHQVVADYFVDQILPI